jgi:hypothetical protein
MVAGRREAACLWKIVTQSTCTSQGRGGVVNNQGSSFSLVMVNKEVPHKIFKSCLGCHFSSVLVKGVFNIVNTQTALDRVCDGRK